MVLTGARFWTLRGEVRHPTGFWVEEFAVPHRIFRERELDITIATPGGVTPVADEFSLRLDMNNGDEAKIAELRQYLDGSQDVLAAAVPLEDVDPSAYDAVFIPGGHGPMEDLSVNPAIGLVLRTLLDDETKVVASICHGPSSFFPATDANGDWLFAGRHITAFLNVEEEGTGLASRAKWLLETRLRENGANFDAGPIWEPHIVVEGNLVTGQNPASAGAAAHAVLDQLRTRVS
jgi:putative intracellular protease/amidase